MALDADDYQDIIDAAAAGFAEVSTNAGSVKGRSLDELIAAKKQAAADSGAANGNFFGARVRRARFRKSSDLTEDE